MGIPGLYKWLQDNFGNYIKRINVDDKCVNCEYLFIDSNPLIHSAASKVFNYGPFKKLGRVPDQCMKEKILSTYKLYIEYINDLINFCNPKKIFVAVDGVAPFAKQNQQRQRRFLSAKSIVDKNFSPAWITPGTKFMYDLCEYAKFKLAKLSKKFDQIIFSSSNVPGEGEHKIMNYIRENNIKKDVIFYGPDGDLLLLGPCTGLSNIKILKHELFTNFVLCYIDIVPLMEEFAKKYSCSNEDVTLVFNFLGNDFLPRIKMLKHLDTGIEFLFSIVKDHNIVKNGKIDFLAFKNFVKKIKDYEEKFLVEQLSEYDDNCEKKYVDTLLLSCQGKNFYSTFQKKFYKKEGNINQMCQSFLKVFFWCYEYYRNGLPCWTTFYEFYEAPLMIDFYEYIKDIDDYFFEKQNLKKQEKLLIPFVQLLTVLPKKLCFLLPEHFSVFYDKNSEYYIGDDPETVIEDYEGKSAFHVIVRLPFCDRDLVIKKYKKFRKRFFTTYKRNSIDQLFVLYPTQKFLIKSKYGTISS